MPPVKYCSWRQQYLYVNKIINIPILSSVWEGKRISGPDFHSLSSSTVNVSTVTLSDCLQIFNGRIEWRFKSHPEMLCLVVWLNLAALTSLPLFSPRQKRLNSSRGFNVFIMTVKVWTSPLALGCSHSPVPTSPFWKLSSLMLWSQCEKMTSSCKYWFDHPPTPSSRHIDQELYPLLSQQRITAKSLLLFQTSHLVRGNVSRQEGPLK